MTSSGIRQALAAAEGGRRLLSFEAMALAEFEDLATLASLAEALCLAGHGTHVSFSKKVFIPLTQAVPRRVPLLHVRARAARAASRTTCRPRPCWRSRAPGQAAGCKEALFTLGDQPELRYAAARDGAGARSAARRTLDYLERVRARWCSRRPACCRTSIPA